MSLNAAMIQMMVDKGLSAQDIADIAKAGEAKADRTNAERQARYRANRKAAKEESITRYSNAVTPPNDNSNPPVQTTSDEVVTKPRRRKSAEGTELAADWEPILTANAQRVVDGWPPGYFERTLSAFRNHAADKGRKSKDWQAAFRTWIDNADKWKPKDDRPTASNDEVTDPFLRAIIARQAARSPSVGG